MRVRALVERFPSAACSRFSRLDYPRSLPPSPCTSWHKVYNGRAIAPPTGVPTNPEEAKREWKTLLTSFGIEEPVANGLIAFLVDTEGLQSFDDFRCNFHESSDFRVGLVAKAKMPDGLTEISKQGFHAARMRQVWEAVTSAHKVQQDIRAKGAEGIKPDELMDVSDINDLRDWFWNRYHATYPADITPGDALVSRKKKEFAISSLPPATPSKQGASISTGTLIPRKKRSQRGLPTHRPVARLTSPARAPLATG